MGYLKYVKSLWNKGNEESSELMRVRKIQWRKEPTTVRIDRPTRIDRARALGWKPKKGFVVVRQRLSRGGHTTPHEQGGRKTSNSGTRKVVSKSYQIIAEERVQDKYPNCEVLNSYYVTKDGKSYWYEVILVDRASPDVYMNKNTAWARDTIGKVYRGKTSAGKKSRGLRNKGQGAEKIRPSFRSNKGRH
ncbi:50S ribosomal protein L15e [Candidatus Woesearchaeota archaeon]|nr:50S ribosomal protein L15e [Candidatus Woesearchaeota archaeon]MCF7901735.1 50S ribosomal protein L15e [Candidatus Woesearchaeota archaeon]MCF8013634.1 50S ribosomal protein L15e [Candidatus Woesearchaeota archaeon]